MSIKKTKQVQQHNPAAPLLCWDIFMEGYYKKVTLAEDKVQLDKMAGANLWQQKWNLDTILFKEGKVILVTDPLLQIVFASSNITAMNGYAVAEVLHKTPRIFQGKDTDERSKKNVREAIHRQQQFAVSLVNYKKNGEPYHCNIEGYPIFNKQKALVNFIAFESVVQE